MAYKVGDFTFETEAEAEVAQKESQAIAYITKQIDLNNPEAVLATYRMMISKDLFHTALGIAFLQEVHDMLMQQPGLKGLDIPEIPEQSKTEIEQPKTDKKKRNKKPRRRNRREKQMTEDVLKYKKRSEILSVICGTMLVIILAMFVINATSEHPTILNYEEKIVNKYAAWEEELYLREQELKQREQELQ